MAGIVVNLSTVALLGLLSRRIGPLAILSNVNSA